MDFPAGNFNRKIRIEARPTARDADYGTATGAWTSVCTPWAWIEDVMPSKGERTDQNLRLATRPTRVRIHYRTDITPDMRIVLTDRSNRVLKIISGPAELGGRRYLEMMAEDYSAAGEAA